MIEQVPRLLRPLARNARDLGPIVTVIACFQLLVAQEPIADLAERLVGLAFVLLGLTLFLCGLSMSIFPMGERLSEELARRGSRGLLMAFAFAIGCGSTIAEPALAAVAEQAAQAMASGGEGDVARIALSLRLAASLAVGLSVVVSCVRILRGWHAFAPVLVVYAIAALVYLWRPTSEIAFDAGAAATSAINIPLIATLGIGLATVLRGRSPLADGMGAVALASAMPMITILLGSLLIG